MCFYGDVYEAGGGRKKSHKNEDINRIYTKIRVIRYQFASYVANAGGGMISQSKERLGMEEEHPPPPVIFAFFGDLCFYRLPFTLALRRRRNQEESKIMSVVLGSGEG